jgi:hypothetical protein
MRRLQANAAKEICRRQNQARQKPATALNPVRLLPLLLFFCLAGGGPEASAQAGEPLNLPGEIGGRIAQCWKAPRTETAQIVEVTVRLSFTRAGAVIGEPRVVYVRAPAEPGVRERIVDSVLAAVKACTPLPFTPALGAAIAGRMLAIRFRSLPGAPKRQTV